MAMDQNLYRVARHTIGLAMVFGIAAAPAQAYIDPGSGMLFIQSVIALVGATLVFIRNPIKIIRGWIERVFRRQPR